MLADAFIRPVLIGAVIAAVAAAGVQTVRLSASKHMLADLRLAVADEHAREAQAALAAVEANRMTERARSERMQEIEIATQNRTRAAGLDAAGARDAADRLRARAGALAAGCSGPAGNPAAATVDPPAADTAVVLADVLGRIADRAVDLARLADQRGAAGDACERAYGSLRE